jgi:hypothetical protein
VVSPVRHQRRKQEVDILQGEMRKLKTPSFDGEREREDDAKHGFLGSRDIFSCITIFLTLKPGLPPTIYTRNVQCGGTNLIKWNMLMKVGSLGRSSRSNSIRSTSQRIYMTRNCRSSLTQVGKNDYGRIREEVLGIVKVCQVHW